MKKKIAVLGGGMVGSAIALDLSGNYEVTSIDIDNNALERIRARNNAIGIICHDLSDPASYDELLKPYDIVVTAVPGFMGYKTLEAVINAGRDVVDISFFPEDALSLDHLAKQKNVTAIVDCGVAPGMTNLILGYYNERMTVESFECMVGGLPKYPEPPFNYKAPFSPIDVIEEYTRPARFVEDGELVTMPALSDAEIIELHTGNEMLRLESFNTDGLRSLLHTMKNIPSMKEKTLRYPGHIDLIKAFIGAGFFDTEKIQLKDGTISPIEFSSGLLFKQWKLKEDEPEFTIMQVRLKGSKNDKTYTVVYDLYDEYDPGTKTSSMARTTGYTCTAAVNLLTRGIFNDAGVFPPELVGKDKRCFKFILQYLEERNVRYRVSEL